MEADLTPIAIPMRSKRRRRAQLVQKIQHLLPAVLLIFSAGATFQEDPHGAARVIAIVEAVVSLLFIASVARAVRQARTGEATAGHAHAIDWADVFVAGVFFAEGVERWRVRGHTKIMQPAFLTALGMLLLGLFHGRIFNAVDRHRSLRVDDNGLSMGRRPFGRFTAPWTAITSIDVDARYARIVKRDGRERRIDFHDLEDPGPVRRALEDARRRIERT